MKTKKCKRRVVEARAALRDVDRKLKQLSDRLQSACGKSADPQLVRDVLDARLAVGQQLAGVVNDDGEYEIP